MLKRASTAIVSVFALSVIMAGSTQAACDTSLKNVDQALDQKARAGFGTEAQDIRRLRNAASLLADYGKGDACETVMTAAKEIANEPNYQHRQTSLMRDRPNYASRADDRETVSRKEMAAQAQPVMDAQGQVSVEKLNGATVYSSKSGESLGEIEDVVFGGNNDHFAILAHGGFLGLGEKRVKIKLSDIKVNRNDDSYYVPLTADTLEAAAAVEWRNGQWDGQAVKANTATQ
jgi:hypothetical protein